MIDAGQEQFIGGCLDPPRSGRVIAVDPDKRLGADQRPAVQRGSGTGKLQPHICPTRPELFGFRYRIGPQCADDIDIHSIALAP